MSVTPSFVVYNDSVRTRRAAAALTVFCPPFQQQQAAYPALMVSGIHKHVYVPCCRWVCAHIWAWRACACCMAPFLSKCLTIASVFGSLENTIIHLLDFACVCFFFFSSLTRAEKKGAKSRSLSWNIKLEEIGQTPFFIYYCLHLWPSNEGSLWSTMHITHQCLIKHNEQGWLSPANELAP